MLVGVSFVLHCVDSFVDLTTVKVCIYETSFEVCVRATRERERETETETQTDRQTVDGGWGALVERRKERRNMFFTPIL